MSNNEVLVCLGTFLLTYLIFRNDDFAIDEDYFAGPELRPSLISKTERRVRTKKKKAAKAVRKRNR